MFDSIAPRYDFLNRSLSLGIDQLWRKKAIRSLKEINPKQILDVATGTGDFAFEARAEAKAYLGATSDMLQTDCGKFAPPAATAPNVKGNSK